MTIKELKDFIQGMKLDDVKAEILRVHYKYGYSIKEMEKYLELERGTISKMKKLYGQEPSGFIYGKKIRYDVKSKAIIVGEFFSTEITKKKLALKYDVTYQTINNWIKQYGDDYQEVMSSTMDGVALVMSEARQVFGLGNIEKVKAEMISKGRIWGAGANAKLHKVPKEK